MNSTEITGIRSVVLYVADAEESRRFYEGRLGLPVQRETGGRIELSVGPTRLLLHPTDLDDQDHATARHGRTEVYYEVADVDAVVKELTEAGVDLMQPPASEPWGERDACVLDPDGFPVFLTQAIETGDQ